MKAINWLRGFNRIYLIGATIWILVYASQKAQPFYPEGPWGPHIDGHPFYISVLIGIMFAVFCCGVFRLALLVGRWVLRGFAPKPPTSSA
jgi:hypothetical protein